MAVFRLRLTLLGVGAMNSPRYPPAGLLVAYRGHRAMLDGGPGAAPDARIDGWLVSDERGELQPSLRRLAAEYGVRPHVGRFESGELRIEPRPVVHTNHPAVGYLIRTPLARAAWAPEFWEFPRWAGRVDLLFAEAAGWDRPIRFRGGVGGHQSVLQVAAEARRRRVRRVVYAHLGRPALRAIDRGYRPPFGEWPRLGGTYRLPP